MWSDFLRRLKPSLPRAQRPARRSTAARRRRGRFERLEGRAMLTGMAPSAMDDYYSINHDTVLAGESVLSNDYDMDGDPLTASLVSGPANSNAFSFHADGTFTYEPAPLWKGTDSFTYAVSDGTSSVTATVTIEVTNTAPSVWGGHYSTNHNQILFEMSPGVLNGAMDYEGDAMSVTLVSGPAHAVDFQLYANGAFYYEPDLSYHGSDSFTFLVSDGIDSTLAIASIEVTNTAPTAMGLSDVHVNMNAANTLVSLSSAFMDYEQPSGELTYSVTANTNAALFDSLSFSGSQLTLDYAADAHGSAQITVRATDAGGLYAETSFMVYVNRPPVILSFTATAMSADTYQFSGYVDDESLGSLFVTFGGVLAGHFTSVDSNGYFHYVSQASHGDVSATATDDFGLSSSPRWVVI